MMMLLCLAFSYLAQAASLNSSTYFYAADGSNITFTLTAAADTGDLFFRLVGPGDYDWISIGVGSSMKNSLFFIAYPTKNGTGTPVLVHRLDFAKLTVSSNQLVSTTGIRKFRTSLLRSN